MIYITSDPHFNDDQTLVNDLRPFKSAKAFDRHVIKLWNKQAKKGDTIYVIGDMADCDGPDHTSWIKGLAYVNKLKADVVLILGNNEERIIKHFFNNNFNEFKKYCLELGYKEVHKDLYLELNGQRFFLTHKGKNHAKDCLTLFGHTHASGGLYKPYGLCICCELNHYRLFSVSDIEFFLQKKHKFWDKDICLKFD